MLAERPGPGAKDEGSGGTRSRVAELTAKGHRLIAEGHACLAVAQRLQLDESGAERAPTPSWIPARDSPLGNRLTLAKCRSGELESAKIGQKIFVRRSSLSNYLEKHRRSGAPPPSNHEEEDLFGAAS
jgi:hypothetical protein